MRSSFRLALAAATLVLSACGGGPAPSEDAGTPSDDPTTSTAGSAAPSTTTASTTTAGATSSTVGPAEPAEPASGLVLTPTGLGPLELGMTEAAASATGAIGPLGPGCEPSGSRSAPLAGSAATGSADFVDGVLGSIFVTGGAPTEEGVAVGDSLAALEASYAGRAQVLVDRSVERIFGVWTVTVSRNDGGSYGMLVDPATQTVTRLAIPLTSLCD